jgi:hypothetical protein
MATHRPFCYNPSPNPPITNTEQVGSIAAGINNPEINPGEWWNGPDEEIGYVIAYLDPSGDHPNGPEDLLLTNYICHLGFLRTGSKSDLDFVKLVRKISGNNSFVTGTQAKDWLTANGYWTSWPGALPSGMVLFLDAGFTSSFSGTGSNTWYDLSGKGNHGTLENGATFSSSNGGTIEFDGVDDYISFASVTDIPIGNESYTISAWFNSNEMPSDRGFIGWGNFGSVNEVNAWRLRNNSGNTSFRHYWWGNDLDYDTPTQLSTGIWYHGLVTYDGVTRSMWINGEFVGSDTPVGHNVPYASNLTIGVTAQFLGEWFYGKLSQIIVYNRGVNASEVEMIYSSGKNRFGYDNVIDSGLLLHLDAGSTYSYIGTGTTWEDLKNNNDSTLINTPTYNSNFGGYLSFDDTSLEYATAPDLGNLSNWTVEVWFRLSEPLSGKISSLVTNAWNGSTSLNFSIGTNNAPVNYDLCIGFFDSNWRNTSGFTPNVGEWYQVVGTYDGSVLRQYVNGTASGGTLNYSGIPTSGGLVRFMRRWDDSLSSSNLIKGDLQVVRIYDRALSSSEVTHNYNMNVARFS